MHAISRDDSDESSAGIPVLSDILVSHPELSYREHVMKNTGFADSIGTPSYRELIIRKEHTHLYQTLVWTRRDVAAALQCHHRVIPRLICIDHRYV